MIKLKTLNQMTQRQRIHEHLKSGKSITVLQSIRLFGCSSLPQRVAELRKEPFYYLIETHWVTIKRGKTHKTYAEYKMA
jgi:hypothetical protein